MAFLQTEQNGVEEELSLQHNEYYVGVHHCLGSDFSHHHSSPPQAPNPRPEACTVVNTSNIIGGRQASETVEVLELKDIRREYHLALARSKLPNCATGTEM
ncbi:hypothetical protein J6590_062225 [Homalodisca vitripennis]|nr:hypothetical protein J6590_062225 [Homalodisca vitripennis]